MNKNMQMDTMTSQSDRQDAMGGDDYEQGGGTVELDKSVPEIAEAFSNCKEGDMYKVVKDDENMITLEKQPGDDAEPDNTDKGEVVGDEPANAPKSDNPAIALIMSRRNKM